jgi:protease-4
MKKNTFSLLNSNWMFAQNSETSLYPFLFDIINSNHDTSKNLLSETRYSYVSDTGMQIKSAAQDKVAVLQIHHPIFKYDQFCGPQGTQTMMARLEEWKSEPSIIGVVLNFNSGGGQVTGTAEFAEYLYNYSKPVVAFTKDLLGSAAYYIAAGTDHIVTHKHADFIGCIGTMVKQVNIDGILKQQGATINEFYADLSPEKNKQSRALDNGDPKPMIEEILNPMAQKFHDDLKTYRPGISAKALKGDIFTPENALEHGLVDTIGTLADAIDKVFELSEEQKSKKIQNKMNTNFPNIQEVLNMDGNFESTDNGVYLNEEQLQTLESHLTTQTTIEDTVANAVVEATDPLQRTINTAAQEASLVTQAIDAALEDAEVERADMTNAEAVAHLSALVAEYGKRDGANPTTIVDDADAQNKGNSTIVSGVNLKEALNC